MKQRGEEIREKKTNPSFKARRWVVEVSHSWFNRFRKLLVRYEKLTDTYMALLHMAAAIIAFRKVGVIYGYTLNMCRCKGNYSLRFANHSLKEASFRSLRARRSWPSLSKWQSSANVSLGRKPEVVSKYGAW